MKEYNEAKKILDQKYASAKKELAEKVRPVFHQKFKDFFEQFPEVGTISWDMSTDIYDDETYEDGVENIKVLLDDKYTTEDFRDDMEDYGWEDYSYMMTSSEYQDHFIEAIGSIERISVLMKAMDEIGYFIYRSDIDFLQNVFERDCNVKVTKEGFTVE